MRTTFGSDFGDEMFGDLIIYSYCQTLYSSIYVNFFCEMQRKYIAYIYALH